MIVQILFIIICFLLDLVIGTLLPHSFLPNDIVITSCLGLSALVITQRKMNKIDSLLISVVCGLFYDFYVAHTFLVCTIAFVVVNLLVSMWQYHITDSLLETCLLVFTTIFVKEFLVYFLMSLLSETSLPFILWLSSRAIFTLLFNSFLVVLIVWISRYVEDMMLLREKKIRKEETISWWKISSKQ
ncbi:MAG: hypothetical protein ACI4U3_05110 [Traorella sp.]